MQITEFSVEIHSKIFLYQFSNGILERKGLLIEKLHEHRGMSYSYLCLRVSCSLTFSTFLSCFADVKQYANLIKSLSFLLNSYEPKASDTDSRSNEQNGNDALSPTMFEKRNISSHTMLSVSDSCMLTRPAFLMSWRRRIGKEEESLFFSGCKEAGLEVDHLGCRVYCIKQRTHSSIG